ncbi:MAG: hypothetical protein ACRCYP_01840 [Alphaproteobacteria bacterium]
MKKVIIALSALILSANVMAQGAGGAGAMSGMKVEAEQLQAKWNGKEGTQQTAINGAVIEWQANDKGEQVAKIEGGKLICKGQTGGGCYWEK